MPSYKRLNWSNIMDLLDGAKRFGESDDYLYDPSTEHIHLVEATWDEEKEFSLKINKVDLGEDFSMGEAYNFIVNCIAGSAEE